MRKAFLTTIILIIALTSIALTQSRIIPTPIPHGRIPPLTLKYQRVNAEINNQIAETVIEQVFLNNFHRDIEGTYIFAIPPGASVTDFAMYMNGRKVKGELLDSNQARKIYEDIVRRLKDPGLLEFMGRNIFRARVYPIPARGETKIELKYSEKLNYEAGLVRYIYPLKSGETTSAAIKDFSLAVNLKSKTPIKSIYSPSHPIDVSRKNDHQAAISFEQNNIVPDKDFTLYYSLSEKEFGLNLLCQNDGDDEGFFMLLISPKTEFHAREISAKDIIFVLDTSGSMRDNNKITQATNALKFGVQGLDNNDSFNIITFSTEAHLFSQRMLPASDRNIKKAINFLNKVDARGGTNINRALLSALDMFTENNHPHMLVFLTDGLPTVEVTNAEEIINNVEEKLNKHTRIFSFGVGYDVNTHLLDTLSNKAKGASDYIKPNEDLELIVSNFFDKINYPVLADLKLNFGRIEVSDLYPQEIPDMFKGSQISLFGRYFNGGKTTITLRGKVENKTKTYKYTAHFSRDSTDNPFIPRLWASRKIGYLLEQIRLQGENQELKQEVIDLSKKYGIVTPYTSYLVLEDEKAAPGVVHRWRQALKDKVVAAAPAAEEKSGKRAVTYSKELKKMKKAEAESLDTEAGVRYVGNKVFFLQNDTWVDNEYKEGSKTIKIEFASTRYFKLLKQKPELKKYFALGEKVIVVYKGIVYEIIPAKTKK
jgi:Ca-activated chloride channel family protein